MDMEDIIARAREIKDKYDELNRLKGSTAWEPQDFMAGFVGDVGDLSKIIMAKRGLRGMDNTDTKLKHELADCLWSILIIADIYKINLAEEFDLIMNELEDRIDSILNSN